MKFGQLIGYNMRNIFLEENRTQNAVEILFPDPSLKNQNLLYLWIIGLKVLYSCFYCIPSWGGVSKSIETKVQTICFHLIQNFLKHKRRSGSSFPVWFFAWLLKKNISLVIFYWRKIFPLLYSITRPNFSSFLKGLHWSKWNNSFGR